MKIHYCGELRIENKNGYSIRLAGWPVCCTGDKAINIAKEGNQTMNPLQVTCKRCLMLLVK